MKLDTRTSPEEEMIYIFSGLLRCGDCGQNMVRSVVKKKGKQYCYYHCSTYKNKEGCTSHNISDVKLQKVVLEAIQKQIALLVQADAIMAQIENIPQQQFGVKLLDSQIRTLNAEVQKYKDLRNNLYQDMVDGIITREEYRDIKQTFTRKMERAEESIRELETKKRRLLSNEMRTQKWVEEFKNCRNIESLDRKVTVMLIERIVIYSSDRIEIHFNHADEMAELISYAFASKDAMQGEVDAV